MAAMPPGRARPPPEEEAIEPEDWDLIVLGTGLAECLVARWDTEADGQRG